MGGICDAGESKPPNNERPGRRQASGPMGSLRVMTVQSPTAESRPSTRGVEPAPAVRFATVPGGDLKSPRHPEAAVLGLVHKASFR
jgi:hypothetical protein